jgi:hypothetical protein
MKILGKTISVEQIRETIATELRARVARFMHGFSAKYVPKPPLEQEVDAIISKKIMEHLKLFFAKRMKVIGARKMSLKIRHGHKSNPNPNPSANKTLKKKHDSI